MVKPLFENKDEIHASLMIGGVSYPLSPDVVTVFYSEHRFIDKNAFPSLSFFLKRIKKWKGLDTFSLDSLSLKDIAFLKYENEMRRKAGGKFVSESDKGHYYDSLSKGDKFLYFFNRKFKKACKRNAELSSHKSSNLLTEKNQLVLKSLDSFVFGVIGEESSALINKKKSILENLIGILSVVGDMDEEEARGNALELLRDVGIPEPKKYSAYRLSQFINEDFQTRVRLAYTLAYSPSILLLDFSALSINGAMKKELLTTLPEICKKYRFNLIVLDDVNFDKDFTKKQTFVIKQDKTIELI